MVNGNESKETANVAPEPSKEIPVLAYNHGSNDESNNESNDDNETGEGSSNLPPEYAMIELNGNLIAPIEFPPGETCQQVFGEDRRVELGKLYRKGPNKTPMMILGNHELTGQVEKLDDPYCLMEKKYNETVTPKEIEAYQIIGIVTEKLLFKNYPKAIMR